MSPITGVLLAKFSTPKQRNIMLLIAAVGSYVYVPAYFVPVNMMLKVYLFLCGVVTGFAAGCVWASVPTTMPLKATIPVGMAILAICQGVANMLATPIIGYVVQNDTGRFNWGNAAIPIAISAVLGCVFMIAYAVKMPPVFEEELERMSV